MTATLVAQDGSKAKITVQPTAGTTVRYRVTSKQTQVLSAIGQENKNETVTEFTVHVDEVGDDGSVRATVTWNVIRGKVSQMMGSFEFDTGKPADDDAPMFAGIAAAARALIGKPVQLTFAPTGRLQDQKPLALLAERAQESLDGMARMSAQHLFSARSLAEHAEVFGTFAATPVAVGDEWQEERDSPGGGMTMQAKTTSKLESKTPDAYVVAVRGELVMAPAKDGDQGEGAADDDPQVTAMKEMMRQAKLDDSKLEGTYTIARKDGMLATGSNTATLSISMPNPMGGDDPFVVKVNRSTKVERITDKPDAKAASPSPKK